MLSFNNWYLHGINFSGGIESRFDGGNTSSFQSTALLFYRIFIRRNYLEPNFDSTLHRISA